MTTGVGEVGSPVVPCEFVDVVRFTPGGRAFASRSEAPPVAHREGRLLRRGEESHLAAEVEHLAARVEHDLLRAVRAGEPLHRLDRHRCAALERPVPVAFGERLPPHEHLDGRHRALEQHALIDRRGLPEQLGEGVGRELVGSAVVVLDRCGPAGLLAVDEARTTQAG